MTTLRELLSVPRFLDLRPLNKNANLDKIVNSIEITETPDVAHYIPKQVFLLTTAMSFRDNQQTLIPFIDSLISVDAAGLGIKINRFLDEVDPLVLEYADQRKFPIIAIPGTFPLGSLLHQMLNYLWKTKKEEITYALDIQKTFSNLLIKDANIDYITAEFGKMIKNPVILLDPFLEVLSYSKHFKYDQLSVLTLVNQIWDKQQKIPINKNNFLISDSQNKEIHIAIYPINAYNYFPHYLIIANPEKIPYPFSSFAIEQAALVFSFVLYKNFKIAETQQKLQKDLLFQVINQNPSLPRIPAPLLEISSSFSLFNSSYNQVILIQILDLDGEKMFSKLKYREETIQLILNLFHDKISNVLSRPVLLSPWEKDTLVFLHQGSPIDIKILLTDIAEALEKKLPVQLIFFFGGVRDTIEKAAESFTEAKFAQDSSAQLQPLPRINHFQPQGIYQLFANTSSNVVKYFSSSILKDLAYPEEETLIELQKTLKCYLDNQCEITKTATDLFVHRNTVKYRIERCEKIIGEKINDPTVSLNIRLALKLIQLEK